MPSGGSPGAWVWKQLREISRQAITRWAAEDPRRASARSLGWASRRMPPGPVPPQPSTQPRATPHPWQDSGGRTGELRACGRAIAGWTCRGIGQASTHCWPRGSHCLLFDDGREVRGPRLYGSRLHEARSPWPIPANHSFVPGPVAVAKPPAPSPGTPAMPTAIPA